MEIKGTVILKTGLETGTTTKGNSYKKQFILIETQETYPKKVYIQFWGDKTDALSNVYVGAIVTVSINIESREFNGKYYTNIDCWKLTMEASEAAPAPAPVQSPAMQQAAAAADFINALSGDQGNEDLPF